MEPFIYTFKTPNNYYFYDVNKDEIVPVNEGIYLFLQKKRNLSDLSGNEKNMIDSLFSNGYLSDNRVRTLCHPNTEDVEFEVNNRACELVLQVTQMCNLCCSYCAFADSEHSVYQRKRSNRSMSWETARKSIDDFLDNSFENTDVHFGFYGGEPFAEFPLVKKCVEYIEENFVGKRIHFTATTNGTLLNDEVIGFIVRHNIHMMFSIDGPKSIHDASRKRLDGSGSFDAAYSALRRVVETYGERYKDFVSIHMVINPANDVDEADVFFKDDFMKSHDIPARISIASDSKRDEPFEKSKDFNMKIKYRSFQSMASHLKLIDIPDLSRIDKSLMEGRLKTDWRFKIDKSPLEEKNIPGGPCIPGKRKVFVDINGDYYPCERVSENLESMKIGSVTDGINTSQCKELLNFSQKTANMCRNCFAFRYCGVCIAHVNFDDFSYESKKRECDAAKKSFANILRYEAFEQEYNNLYRKELNK